MCDKMLLEKIKNFALKNQKILCIFKWTETQFSNTTKHDVFIFFYYCLKLKPRFYDRK